MGGASDRMLPFPSAMDYRYHVQRIPFMDYNSKQVDPLLSKEEVLREGGVHQARWRLQRKRYSVRVEFQLAGSLGILIHRQRQVYLSEKS